MTRTAQCLCGSASISVSGEPRLHAVSHSAESKRRTGSAFGISTYFLRSNVTDTTGEMLVYAVRRGDDDQESHFCKKCGTTLYWYTAARAHLVGIAGGCFPDGSLGEPTISNRSSEKLAWVGLPNSWKFL